jgi:uncharacterized spore protein YtfJ
MELQTLISGARDIVSVKRVYGDPYEKNGLTVIPAATVRGGGGGGGGPSEGEGDSGSGGGGGFGLIARPSGAWIIENGRATWKPAIDVNRIVLGAQVVALTAILVRGRVLLARSRRRHPLREFRSLLPGAPHLRTSRSRLFGGRRVGGMRTCVRARRSDDSPRRRGLVLRVRRAA